MVIDSPGWAVLQVVTNASGGGPAPAMATASESGVVALWRSVAVRVKVTVKLEIVRGAVKVVDGEAGSLRTMSSAESWVHR